MSFLDDRAPRPGRWRRGSILVAASLSLAVIACSGAGATPTPVPPPSEGAAPSAAATAAPSPAVRSPLPSGATASLPPDIGVNPDRTLPPGMTDWPPSVVSATIALAAADNEFKKAAADWTTGAETRDMELLLNAAQGMAQLATASLPNAQRIAAFPATATVGSRLVDAYGDVAASGTAIAEAMLAGDGAATQAALVDLATAMQTYGTARSGLVDITELALVMRRGMLVK